jgi:DNA-directed RNA polymerase subunit D
MNVFDKNPELVRMKIKIFKRIKNENLDLVKFVLEGASIEFANAFRRIILTEVPTMAITEVLFVENDSVLFDEIIAHRLGLVPLTTDLKNYNLPDECSCGGQGCTLCQVQLMSEVHAENTQVNVYSSDLESMDNKVKPVSDKILLAKLGKRTSLVFEAYATLGRGKKHAKFQPVCSIGYKYFPDVKIDHSKFSDDPKERKEQVQRVVEKDHTKMLIEKDGKLALVKDYWQVDGDFTHIVEKYAPEGGLKINYVPNKVIFSLEGSGALEPKEICLKAVEVFLEKLDEFEDQLHSLDIEVVKPKISMR